MAENNNNDKETAVDIFQTLKKVNESLVEALLEQTQKEGPTYIQPQQPMAKAPNYLLYIGIGIVLLFIFWKKV